METPLARRAGDQMTMDSSVGGQTRMAAPARNETTAEARATSIGTRVVTTRRVSNGVPVVTTRLADVGSLSWQGSVESAQRWEDGRPIADAPVRTAGQRSGLGRLLDALEEGLVLCDQIGRIVHSNRAVGRLLADEMERARLHGEVRAITQMLAERMHRRSRLPIADVSQGVGAGDEVVEREFETARARFTLRATYLGPGLLAGAGGAVLVAVDRPAAAALSRTQLQTRYGLTSREVDVAIELAHGRSNAAIARALSISPHTARHHAEKIFLKLGVHSRAEVGRVVLGGTS